MVHRKAPNKLGSQTESKKNHPISHQHQDTRNKGGNDLKKKMKKARSIKVSDLESFERSSLGREYAQFDKPSSHKKPSQVKKSDGPPNYMKPTSSSDARKERLQVTVHPPISTDRNRSPKNSNNLNYSKPASSAGDGNGLKHKKTFTRKSSLRPVRPSMKKSRVASYSRMNVNKATCSSTLKDSKFPNALDLNPGAGGAEYEGTSIMKVCPYTYCSLNGHRHAALPPLKRFLSARRRVLKTQRSLKLKGLPSFKVKRSGKAEKERDREEGGDNFFIEIYANPQARILNLVNFDEKGIQEEDNSENQMGDGGKGIETDLVASQIDESYSEMSFEDDLHQKSDISIAEMDVLTDFLEYVELDQHVEAEDEENILYSISDDYAEWCFECCSVNFSGKNSQGLAESEANVSTFESTDMGWEEEEGQYPDNKTDYSEYPDDGSDLILAPLPGNESASDFGFSSEPAITSSQCEKAGADAELLYELYNEVAEEDVEIGDASLLLEIQISDCPRGFPEKGQDITESDHIQTEMEIEVCKCDDVIEDPSVLPEVHDCFFHEQSNKSNSEGRREKSGKDQWEEFSEAEGSICNSLGKNRVEINDSVEIKDDVQSDANEICLAASTESPEEDTISITSTDSDQPLTEAGDKVKARYNITRKRKTDDLEEMKEFNPRPPQFLPIEADPEAEKVDLRHQMSDERKNAEEWMIDYALQQAVTKLAPARKRRVELLVEAFETVMPLPCETPFGRDAASFSHSRPMQACS